VIKSLIMENNEPIIFNFEKLIVYQRSVDFIDFVYSLTDKFPKSEIYNLTSQYNRASTSIALNIGEGSGGTEKDFINFIRISYKSLNECIVCSTIALRRNYISEVENEECRKKLSEISRMLSGLSNSLKRKIESNAINK
jgi:four helix bundle protein